MQLTGHTSTQSEQYMQRESSITNPTAKGLALPEPSMSRFSCSMEMQWSGQILMHCRQAMHRSMSTVSKPRLRSGSGRLYSGYWRVTFPSKRCLRVIPIPFRIPCPTCGIRTFLLQNEHRAGRDEQPDEGYRDEDLPSEVHELVHPQAGDGPPDPLEGEDYEGGLEPEPDPVEGPEVEELQRRLPAPEEQRDGDRGHQAHRGELGRLDKGPGHPRVLDHVTADDLALALRQVERYPFYLGEPGDVERDKHRQLRPDVPVPEPALLGVDYVHEREAPGQHDDAEEAQDQGHLVGDYLRRAPQSAEKREVGPAPVAGHDDAQGTDGRDRHEEQDGHVEVRNHGVRRERGAQPPGRPAGGGPGGVVVAPPPPPPGQGGGGGRGNKKKEGAEEEKK